MKKVYVLMLGVALLTGAVSCTKKGGESGNADSTAVANGSQPVFALQDSATYDFGTVKEGAVVEKKFAFRNEGKSPLVISNINSSCGCTTPEWPKEPIAPQGESTILVRFNTKGKAGPQSKTVTISANTDPAVIELHLKGIVEAAAAK